MKEQRIPLLESSLLRGLAKTFIHAGNVLVKVHSNMPLMLRQSGISVRYKICGREYLSLAAISSLLLAAGLSTLLWLVINLGGRGNPRIGVIIGLFLGLALYLYFILYPHSIVNKRVKYIERNLLFALRSILIQIRSGIPIFNTLVAVSRGSYGPISSEFKYVVDQVNSGKPIIPTLENLAVRNPSIYFRRALWQLVNAMKSGSDVGDNLADVIRSLSKEQLVEVKKYQSALNPLAMMYMMAAVVIPSLSITLLIILSTFPGMGEIGNERTFWILLVLTILMQFVFMGVIKSRRPNLIGS